MIQIESSPFEIAALTDPGSTGKNNEDRYAYQAFELSETDSTPVLFAMVADGIGGKQAGELAAEIAAETIMTIVKNSDGTDPVGTMRRAILEANDLIIERSSETLEQAGMGTTSTLAWIVGNQLFAANVGNSRLYLLRDQQLQRISIDHSWVQEAMELGLLTPEQARKHPNARIITRHLGSESMEPDFRIKMNAADSDAVMEQNQGLQLLAGDLLLICSDGLSDVDEEDEIEKALNKYPMQEALQRLTDLANERGGPDNITSVAIRIPEINSAFTAPTIPIQAETAPETAETQPERKPSTQAAVYILSIVILVALVLLGWMFLPLFIP